MRDLHNISKLHAEIWFLHDSQEYSKLRAVVKRYVELNRGPSFLSNALAKELGEAFILYGHLKYGTRNYTPSFAFGKMFSKFQKVFYGNKEVHPVLQSYSILLWWKASFYKNDVKLLRFMKRFISIFLLHWAKVGFLRPVTALTCTKFFFLAGYHGHDKKNFEVCKQYLKKYWENVPPDANFISF